MKKRLVWLVECVHGYESGCSFGDCVGGAYEPAEIDYDAARVVYFWRDDLKIPWESKVAAIVDAAIGRDE